MQPPYEPAPLDRYCRLFPPADPSFDFGVMQALGLSMKNSKSAIPDAEQRTPLPVGYTYFGQFVDHDLTLDETPLPDAVQFASIPAQTVNAADGRLNLNHLYGAGPASVRHSYLYAADGVSFRLGDVQSSSGQTFDLPVGKHGPQSAEDRNQENIILRQICAMFLKLHNLAVQELPSSLEPIERFHRAMNRVRWQYQWLIREDFLYRVTHREVYQEVIRNANLKIDWRSKGFSIPVEFSQAAFRFGHSMVRARYDLNSRARDVPLRTIFAGPQRYGPIEPEKAIDWCAFFGSSRQGDPTRPPRRPNPAMPIDTTVVPPLFRLPSERVHHFTDLEAPPLPPQLAVRTLQRGAGTRLASGEQVARALGYPPLRERGFKGGEQSWKKLDELGLTGRTPLWYYVLLEAEVERLGVGLGTVGSHLVAEVIDGCLKTDPSSYISCFGSTWKPPAWKTSAGQMIEIRQLADLAVATGLTPTMS